MALVELSLNVLENLLHVFFNYYTANWTRETIVQGNFSDDLFSRLFSNSKRNLHSEPNYAAADFPHAIQHAREMNEDLQIARYMDTLLCVVFINDVGLCFFLLFSFDEE